MLILATALQAPCDWQDTGQAIETMYDYNAMMQQQASPGPTDANR